MRGWRSVVVTVAAAVLSGACSPAGDEAATGTTTTDRRAAPCSRAAAREATRFVVAASGFTVTCARAKKEADVSFVNDVDGPAEVSLDKAGAENFKVELPNKGSTFSRRFSTPGTYTLTSKPAGTLTLIVTD